MRTFLEVSAYLNNSFYDFQPSILRGSWMRKPPVDNGSVRTGTDKGSVVGADLDAGDAAAVRCSYVSNHTVHVVPHLHQFVIAT